MSSFDIKAILHEITPLIVDKIVDNVYQPSSHILLISFNGLHKRLILEAGRRINLTSYRIDVSRRPPLFCKAIRKYLRRSRLVNVSQVNFERIVKLEFETSFGKLVVYTELFAKGNHILVDNTGKILQALTFRRMKDRNILRDEIFQFPPSKRFNILDVEYSIIEILSSVEGSLIKQLTRLFNIGGLYAEEIILRAGLDKNASCEFISKNDIDSIHKSIKSILSSHHQPHIVFNEHGSPRDVLSFHLQIFKDYEKKDFSTFNEAVDEYYKELQIQDIRSESSSQEQIIIDEQKRILNEQKTMMKGLEKSVTLNHMIGDIIQINAYRLDDVINKIILRRRSGAPWDIILKDGEKPEFLQSVNSNDAKATVEFQGIRFKIDLRQSVYENASQYYEKSKNSKAKLGRLTKLIQNNEDKLKQMLKLKLKIDEEEVVLEKRRQREWYEKFHWMHTSEGFLVLCGRDATTNEIIIKQHTVTNDIILHADIHGSPFAVIKTLGKTPSEVTINEAAQMVASYSRAWRIGLTSIDVYWVLPEQVSKTPPSGEYLPKGSFMIRGSRNYVKNVPLSLAIGIKNILGQLIVIGGPTSAIATQTDIYVNIIPGRIKTGKLVKEIIFQLHRKASNNLQEEIKRIPIEEFQAIIPGGRGEIAKK
jgi:predicted ribosome quality control (RQC) complex YloA/Tae2 family protein